MLPAFPNGPGRTKKVSLALRNTQAFPETPRLTGRKNLEIGIQTKLED